MFERRFFQGTAEGVEQYRQMVANVADALVRSLPSGPYAGDGPADLAALIDGVTLFPARPAPTAQIISQLQLIAARSIALWDPGTAAHLHTPVLLPALAAEMVISALNQSMDSFDQAPMATVVEQAVSRWLCTLAGLPAGAAGTFTAGGTQSNYMGLLLARDHFLATRWGWSARTEGLHPDARRMRILCSAAAHFSVEKAAIQLGLGTNAVVKVPCDAAARMSTEALEACIRDLKAAGREPIAVVATAGTTDFGAIDPLATIAVLARREGLWLHVDAAYGGALLLSTTHAPRLAGIEQADSIAIDFHKAFFQPISCAAFLLADARRFDLIRVNADYLNSEEREAGGIPDLVTQSLLTTRRFDALKLWVSLQALGREEYGAMVDRLVAIARVATAELRRSRVLDPLHEPELGCVIFRYDGGLSEAEADVVNATLPDLLLGRGAAIIGHTRWNGRPLLKCTFSNPCVSDDDVAALIQMIERAGNELALKLPGRPAVVEGSRNS